MGGTGEHYRAGVATSNTHADKEDTEKRLDDFAASGMPSANALSRELLTLVPKLSPPAPENATSGTGLVDRLQAGAAKLVRIERTDTVGHERRAVVARGTPAALRNRLNDGPPALKNLTPPRSAHP